MELATDQLPDVLDRLKRRLQEPLPGFTSQKKMAPTLVDGTFMHDVPPPPDCRNNAVLVLLYYAEQESKLRIYLTERSSKMPSHAGEICCPGGRIESGESIMEAALREAREEINLDSSLVTLLGNLSPLYVPVSKNLIHPVVGFAGINPPVKPDNSEVSGVLSLSVDQLLSTEYRKTEQRLVRDSAYIIPFWDVFDVPLWGATAMILSEFSDVMRS
ncbi:MAG: CoA pyrophosphatase [Balneolales bacterium]|nr:CoA pyrophosphatase [Balneolales bacterium]